MFTTDSRTENYLTQQGVKYEYEDAIPYTELHEHWKSNNLGRNQPIDADAVLDYGVRMEGKSPAPAVIVIQGPGGYLVLDGVQRLCAADSCGSTSFAAYVLSPRTSLKNQHLIRVCSNMGINGGHTPDKGWVMQQAVDVLVFGDGMSPEEVARAIGRPVGRIREEVRFQKTSQQFQVCGYDGPLSSRNKRWFVTQVGEAADQTDFELAPKPVSKFLRLMERCNFKNGGASIAIETFFGISRKAKKDRFAQLEHSFSQVQELPEVREKLRSKRKSSKLESLLPAMRSTNTLLEQAIERKELVHDGDFALQLSECLRRTVVLCKSVVPYDLQYLNNRRSSIFDKG